MDDVNFPKQIVVPVSLYEQVKRENDNFSEAVREALIDWLRMRNASGLSEAERQGQVTKLRAQLKILEDTISFEDRIKDIQEWVKAQTPEMRGTIEMVATAEGKNWFDVAAEYRSGVRKVMLV